MAQRLLFPFRRAMIIAGYKTALYAKSWGYLHYGIDVSSIQGVEQADHIVRASGDGKVVWCAYDTVSSGAKSLGWALAVRYNGCIARDGTVRDIIVRYMHATICYVKAGQTVKAGDPLLIEGTAGTNGYHCHIEMDTDVAYPQYTPQVSAGHSGWRGPNDGARDSTVNPSLWLWQREDARLEPYLTTWNPDWINEADRDLPFVPSGDQDERIAALERELADCRDEIARLQKIIEAVRKAVDS